MLALILILWSPGHISEKKNTAEINGGQWQNDQRVTKTSMEEKLKRWSLFSVEKTGVTKVMIEVYKSRDGLRKIKKSLLLALFA